MFVRIGGKEYRPDKDGICFEGHLGARRHKVTAGFYPSMELNGQAYRAVARPVVSEFEIDVAQGERTTLNIAGSIERGYAVIAVAQEK